MTTTRLWELSEEIRELENAISAIADDETLDDEEKETKLQETFAQWLETGESFNAKAEQVARYIRHQEALAEARKTEARRIRELASQAENQAARLRKYLTSQMILSNVNRIDGVSTKISLRKKQPQVLLNVPPEELPAEYVKVTHKPDLTKIRAALKTDAQGAIDWASLSESHEHSVTIR
ncbi:siphovirus Gp157 family protein [Waterburya agarophytonicola K14]|uniref:Siphovirus Gp157 family protein n=1 Tax=Waterburya agarophytonicola KI4 TaxID=2874699 RepID=A0A964FIF3_9CYAN|nr:siphovirus Gp157 family protein [Waterburya agarophytonicola]MCC0178424.1 siphovirus Gp157 family protein [Waterburya agarophytonicola KI4]